ncbi:ribosome maturation protein SBDS, putative [Plasmodium gallinaceum]|uniref:Ribosome maturation protein SBDS, putative n=1 Tax=Plasmodium gallinaceum TaxID=5849 RepID=A0A1J1GT00_PLAGA|nr:ribosome maturation protein SBDS, putative [Plasmodium gallinaceum]CRG95628.1 ribosome maturation protein SBDS, putative [Plasmodium gallinaceum]
MGALFQPINQVKFTNVAIVKYKHKGKKFEIACYKNKIIDWRDGVELNIDDVLQSHLIFTNISKGEIAKKSELNSCFNSDNNYEICKTILEKGTLQISNKERNVLKEKVYKDMIEILHEMSVNPQTGYPLSTNMIESMVKNIGYSINIDDSAKKQALKVFDILSKEYDNVIQRAFMRIQIICDDSIKKDVIDFLNSHNVIIEEQKLTNNIKREDDIKNKHDQIYNSSNTEKNKEQENDKYEYSEEKYKKDIIDLEQNDLVENNKLENKKDINDTNQTITEKNSKDEYKEYTSDTILNSCDNKYKEENDLMKNNNFINNLSKNYKNIHNKDTIDKNIVNVITENDTTESVECKYLSKSDVKEKNNLLDDKYLEETKNIQNDIFIKSNENLMNECLKDDIKKKQKKKDKYEKEKIEKKGKNIETYKIVFLCYPCVYRYIDDFTKKHKKNCSNKILSNNVKIASLNPKKTNLENSETKCNDTKNKEENKNNKNKKEKKKGKNKNNNNYVDSENENKNKGKIIENNNNGSNVEDHPSHNLGKTLSDETNSLDVIMCTSCLVKIEKCNYKLHCRSDFHVYNVKRKYKKLPPITLEQYKEIDFDVSHFHVDM